MVENDIPKKPAQDLNDLDTGADALRQLLASTGERLAGFISSLPDQPTDSSALFDPQAEWLKAPLPSSPTDAEAILSLLFDEVIPAAYNPASPGYLAYVPGGGLFSAALGELIAGTVNRYTGCWASAPAAVSALKSVLLPTFGNPMIPALVIQKYSPKLRRRELRRRGHPCGDRSTSNVVIRHVTFPGPFRSFSMPNVQY